MKMTPELLTLDEFCKLTSTGKTKVYEEISSGRLKAKKYGRHTRIPRAALEEWIDNLDDYPLNQISAS
jgi:excisionase family DNA binding protein